MQPHPIPLTKEQLRNALANLDEWTENDDRKLVKEFAFKTFSEAAAFMVQLFLIAERMNHHPEIHTQYHTVEVSLQTNRIGAISELDLDFAKQIEGLRR